MKKNPLTSKEIGLMNSFGKVKMVRTFTKIYNKLCVPCKGRVMRNPRIELTTLCDDCQVMIKEVLGKYTEKE